jgi:hypothetical protein
MFYGVVKSLRNLLPVIPAQAGIQCFPVVRILWIPVPHFHEDKFRRNDGF